ncbi:MAG: 16S rRNA (uracil(1498)-N(3))-methyltransferase [Planctomycetes bacterium]|nr:16S rRNA (uracil(1498)-N(3))-methyltransferase [Planctomycetota bacterium]
MLRLSAGDRLLGLTGTGEEWPLVVRAADRRTLELEVAGACRSEPQPGAAGSRLPAVTVLAPAPRPGEAETMADQLAQVGVARWTLLRTERSQDVRGSAPRADRLIRVAQEASKQCGRLWDLEVEGPVDLASALGEGPEEGGSDFLLSAGSPGVPAEFDAPVPVRIWVGPEGGWSDEEHALLVEAGARPMGLSPLILRTSTAAVLGGAALVRALGATRDEPAG